MNSTSREAPLALERDHPSDPNNRPAICSHKSQIPTPEPRKIISHINSVIINTTGRNRTTNTNNNDLNEDLHVAKLVNVQQHESQDEAKKRASLNDGPTDSVADEGVGSPTNIDYDEEEDEEVIADDYYEDEEEFESSEQTDELTNLSRQSMMPLHELIAYYQYIQQGHDPIERDPVSRQSSSASQTPINKFKHSLIEDTIDSAKDCVVIPDGDKVKTEQLDLDSTNESHQSQPRTINKICIPKVFVENIDANKSGDDFNTLDEVKEEEQQPQEQQIRQQVAPLKDRRRIRANVVLELINSERDFVKHLKDVVEGYLFPARRHPEIFTGERINTIFSNIEQLYEFQRKFLESLESCINWDDLASSEVGQCFLDYENGFSVYHYYCNNHPNATSELQDLYTKPRFVKFFEACRLLQNMIDISLDGFLLTPIQKICKYPLQLNELLKNTDEDHPDYKLVTDALESMRNCANLANERKRRIEALADVMSFQEKVDNWFGPKLSDTSSILIHSGEVSKMTSHTWSQGVQLYLFNHLLLYCKKDLLKRNSLILKGRIWMDTVSEITDADEYKPRKSFKLFCNEQQKWFVFTTRSEKEKDEWIKAFERERSLVEADENEGFCITEKEIGVARRALQNRKHSRSARYRHKRPDTAIVDQLDIDDANTIMNRTLSLPSCIHPSHVMNFVEDSKVVSCNRKKSSSPQNQQSSNPRSPIGNCQYMPDQADNQQQSGVGWFKKMGSKKLTRSQVYNINGTGSSSMKPHQASPTTSLETSTSFNKYDQLEKRHRDHMVSEEQARLFRLNNDLPPPEFVKSRTSPQIITRQNRPKIAPVSNPQSQQQQQQQHPRLMNTALDANQSNLNFQSLNLKQNSTKPYPTGEKQHEAPERTGSMFETTVVLSSGRIVRVREDEV